MTSALPEIAHTEPPALWQIALAFNKVSMVSFGGGLTAFARNILVDEKRWLTDEDFLQALSVCQILPGPNTINLATFIGSRLRGWSGSLAALAGLLLIPFLIVLGVTILYFDNHEIPAVKSTMQGLAAAAAGMSFGLGLKLLGRYLKDPAFLIFGSITFVLVGFYRISLIPVVLFLVPPAIAYFVWKSKKLRQDREAE